LSHSSTFSNFRIPLSEQREGKRERQVMPPLIQMIKFVLFFDNFSSKFLFKSEGRQLATFARILVAKYFFHSPWRPKWSQLGALLTIVYISSKWSIEKHCENTHSVSNLFAKIAKALCLVSIERATILPIA